MHKIVIQDLEKYLEGRTTPAVREHLASCAGCRQEAETLADVSSAIRFLRPAEHDVMEPRGGFYGRVAMGIVEQERASGWGMFGPGVAFFRKVAFASLLMLAALGGYLLTSQKEFSVNDAVAIMAHNGVDAGETNSAKPATHRDRILLTLADWSE